MASPGSTPTPDISTIVALFGVGTTVLVVLAVGIILFVTRYQQRLLEQQARTRDLEADLQRRVLEAVLQTQEDERRRIARDLHDDVGTTLSALKMQLYAQNRSTGGSHELTDVLDEVIQRVRSISSQLLPATLEKFGLAMALPALVQQLNALAPTTDLVFEHQARVEEKRSSQQLDRAHELMLYRIVQELLGNALKHAEAQHVWVRLSQQPQHLQLVVEDDGRGFDYAAVRQRPASDQPGGLGLLSMESRVGALRGDIKVDSEPGKGTRTTVLVPLG